jgi:hypothetical protein
LRRSRSLTEILRGKFFIGGYYIDFIGKLSSSIGALATVAFEKPQGKL